MGNQVKAIRHFIFLLVVLAVPVLLAGCQVAKANVPNPARSQAASPASSSTPTQRTSLPAKTQAERFQLASLPSFGQGVIQDFIWAKDGNSLITATAQGINIHDPQTLELKNTIPVPANVSGSFVFGSDWKTPIFHQGEYNWGKDTFSQWDIRTGRVTQPISIEDEEIDKVAASPDGNLLAVLSEIDISSPTYKGRARLWNLKTGSLERTLFDGYQQQYFKAVAFSPDSRWVALGCSDATIYLWDLANPGDPIKLTGHASNISGLAFSPDGRLLVSGGEDGSVRLWDIPGGTPVKTLMEFKGPILQVEISADGRWLAASDKTGLLKLWQLQSNTLTGAAKTTLDIGQSSDKPFAISPNGDVLAVIFDGALRLWSISTHQWIAEDPYYGWLWSSMAWSTDGKTLFSNRGDRMLAWDAQLGTIIRENDAIDSAARSLEISPDGELLAATRLFQTNRNDDSIFIFNTHTGNLLNRVQSEGGVFTPPVFRSDGKWLAVNSADKISIWDPRGGQEIETMPSDVGGHAIYLSSNQMITFDTDWPAVQGELQVWNLPSKTKGRSIIIKGDVDSRPFPLASADGSLAAVVIDEGMPANGPLNQLVEVWDIATGQLRFQIQTPLIDQDGGLAFSPDGSMLAISGYSYLQVVANSNGDLLGRVPLPSSSIIFSPDGNGLAAGGEILHRWDITALHQAALENRPQKTPTPDLRPTPTHMPAPILTPTSPVSLEITPLAPAPSLPNAIQAANAANLALYAQAGKGTAGDLAWSPDGKTIAVAGSLGIYLYDGTTLHEIQHIETGKSMASVAFSPDGNKLAAGSADEYDPAGIVQGQIQTWDLSTLEQVKIPTGYMGGIHQVYFSRDGQKLLFPDEKENNHQLTLWDIAAQKPLQTLSSSWNSKFVLSPDDQFILDSGSSIRRVSDAIIVFTFPKRDASLYSMDWSANGKWVALGYEDGVVQIWNAVKPDEPVLSQAVQVGHLKPNQWLPDSISPEVQFSPNGALLATSGEDNLIQVWDTASGKQLSETTGGLNCLRFSPDGKRLVSIAASGEINLWQVTSDGNLSLLLTQAEHEGEVSSAAFTQDGEQVISGDQASFRAWTVDQKILSGAPISVSVIQTFDSGYREFWAISNVSGISPARDLMASGHIGGMIRIWDVKSGQMIKEFIGSQDSAGLNGFPYISSIIFSSDGKWMASRGGVGDVTIWNTQTWEKQSKFFVWDNFYPAFSPDGRLIAVQENGGAVAGNVHLFETLTGNEVRSFPSYGPLAFSSDGARLFCGRTLLDLRTGAVVGTFPSQSKASPVSAAVNPSGDVLVLGRSDGIIEVWDVTNTKLILTLSGGTQDVSTLSFSKDGRFLLSGNKDGSIYIWNLR